MNRAKEYLPRLFAAMLIVCIITGTFSLSVHADDVYEPFWGDFYYDHIEDIQPVEQLRETNVAGVVIQVDPDHPDTVYTFEDQWARLWIYGIYTDPDTGEQWGYTDYYTGGSRFSGWIPLSYLDAAQEHTETAAEETTTAETTAEKTASESEKESTGTPIYRPDPVKQMPRWIIPTAAAGLLAVTAAILLAILFRNKKK